MDNDTMDSDIEINYEIDYDTWPSQAVLRSGPDFVLVKMGYGRVWFDELEAVLSVCQDLAAVTKELREESYRGPEINTGDLVFPLHLNGLLLRGVWVDDRIKDILRPEDQPHGGIALYFDLIRYEHSPVSITEDFIRERFHDGEVWYDTAQYGGIVHVNVRTITRTVWGSQPLHADSYYEDIRQALSWR